MRVAANPVELEAQLATQGFDYAVVDLKLGTASGLSCVARLHDHDPAILIVVLTGFASIATAVEAAKLGACHYLAKPSNTDDIEEAFGKAGGNTSPVGWCFTSRSPEMRRSPAQSPS